MSQYSYCLPASLQQHVGAVASGSRCRATAASGSQASLWTITGCSDSSVRPTPRSRSRPRPPRSSAVVRHYHHCARSPTPNDKTQRTQRNLSTSTQVSAPPPAHDQHPTPVTYATPAKSPQGPSSWWHRAFSFSSTQRDTARTPPPIRLQHQPPILKSSPPASPSSSSSSAPTHLDTPCDDINTLMNRPDIFDNIKAPRNPIVLCHGLYGFDVRGPFFGLEIHYWAVVLDILREKIGADVIVRGVPGTGSIAQRAQVLHDFLRSEEAGVKGKKLNFIGHSMGGLDARYLISHLKPKPEEYTPVSLTTLSTPHKGSPFMDWCNANVGIGRDHVEDAIREYKQAVAAESTATTAEEQEAESLPYSLKTPLFVRPKKDAKKESTAEQDKDLSASAVADIKAKVDEKIADAMSSKEDGKPNSNKANGGSSSNALKSIASLGFVTPLTRALSSLTGHFSSYMLSVLDTPAYAMLSTRYMSKVFNPSTPDSPDVKYFSIAARTRKIPLWHPLWLPKVILDAAAESRTVGAERDGSAAALGDPETQGNDGLVAVQSAKWGTFLGVIEEKDHWDLRGSGAPRWGAGGKLNPATGKPWPNGKGPNGTAQKNQVDAEQMVPDRSDKDVKEQKGSDEGWLTINRLLGGIIGDKSSEGEGDKATEGGKASEPESPLTAVTEAAKDLVTPDSDKGKSTATADLTPAVPEFVDEVAEWISDRLPQGSAERRKLADEAAEQQEADLRDARVLAAAKPASEFYEPTWAGSDVHSGSENSEPSESPATPPPVTLGSSPTVDALTASATDEETKSRRYMLKLRREADWLESSEGEESTTDGKDAQTLRREIEWHQQEHVKRFGSGAVSEEEQAQTSTPPATPPKKKEKIDREREELERFWIALCQHLHSHGF